MAPKKDVEKCSKGPQYKNKADCEANGGSWDSFASTLTDYAANPDIFQQTFLGLSIMDFSANIGFNSNSSSLSVNLVKDDVNFETYLTPSGTRDAISEGYHPNDPNAFPIKLLRQYNLEDDPDPSNPDTGMGLEYSKAGDIPFIPTPGSPVYFSYYDGNDLEQDCVKRNYDDDGILVDGALTCKKAFQFHGILNKYEKKFSTSGETYNVQITDPRAVLENTTVILNKHALRTAPADGHRIETTERFYNQGWNGSYNVLNVYGYYEYHGFNKSEKNETGMLWNDPNREFISKFGEYDDSKPEDQQPEDIKHAFGILPALQQLLNGQNERYIEEKEPFGGPLYYTKDTRRLELSEDIMNSVEFKDEDGAIQLDEDGNEKAWHIHRYLVDLRAFDELTSRSESAGVTTKSGKAINQAGEGFIPPDWRVAGDNVTLLSLIESACNIVGADFYVTLEPVTKELITDGFIVDGLNETADEKWAYLKYYSGVIKVVPIPRTTTITQGSIQDAVDRSQLLPADGGPKGPFIDNENNPTLVSANLGYEFTDPVESKIVLGAPRSRVVGVTPLGDVNQRKELFFNRATSKYNDKYSESCVCEDASGNPTAETDKATCEAVAGQTWVCRDTSDTDPAPKDTDDILREFLPNVEDDGVTLINQEFPKDTFPGASGIARWNPYGKDGIKSKKLAHEDADFERNLPPVFNDNYLPWYWAEDFEFDGGGIDPYQLNRLNSKKQIDDGTCDEKACVDDKTGKNIPGPADPTACAAQGGTYQDAPTEDICDAVSGTWTKSYSEDSGYLDIFPCWGFETIELVKCGAVAQGSCTDPKGFSAFDDLKTKEACEDRANGICYDANDAVVQVMGESACISPNTWVVGTWEPADPQSVQPDDVFNDIVDLTVRGNPIKGFFNDDDPYRDFHPVDGIFSGLEFFNPSLGLCEEVETGVVNPAYENLPFICECDPSDGKQSPDSDCKRIKGTDEKDYRWRPHCVNWNACRDKSGADITGKIHDSLGEDNNAGASPYTCQYACFKTDSSGNATGPAIAAYYTEAFTYGGTTKKKGERATKDDSQWEVNLANGKVKIMSSAQECTDSGNSMTTPETRQSFPINSSGAALPNNAPPSDMNQLESGGSLYSPGCKAMSYRTPNVSHCLATEDILNADGKVEFHKGTSIGCTADECNNEYVGKAEWIQLKEDSLMTPPPFDDFKGRQMRDIDSVQPGFTQPRVRLKGKCMEFYSDYGAGKKHPAPKPPANEEEIFSEKDCYDQTGVGSENNEVLYQPADLKTGVGLPLVCRTATIPIDLGGIGYKGGPKADVNDPANRFDDFYYATVTELRHAAHGMESWKIYMKNLQPYLPCWFYFSEPDPANAWGDICPARDEVIIHGGKSQTTLEAVKVLTAWGNSSPPPMVSNAVMDQVGHPNKEEAQALAGFQCGDKPRQAGLTFFQKTTMQIDIAYKKIKEVADSFYGKKYLVPLPFNPPSVIQCTNPKYVNKDECEEAGFDWGAHGLLSEWFAKQGVGSCSDGVSPDKYTCEIVNKEYWSEPIQEINRWEIASNGAWPGGDIEFNFGSPQAKDKNTGYPQNMNFWTDEGNLKSFVIFPEKEYRRFLKDSVNIDYRDLDPEQMFKAPIHQCGPDSHWGNKIYVAAEVDSKTHWLKERPDWEIHHQQQYHLYRNGDEGKMVSATGGSVYDWEPDEYLTIGKEFERSVGHSLGKEDLTRTLEPRDVYIREVEIDVNGDQIDKEFAAYKPYALITLPNRVLYQQTDVAHKLMDGLGGEKNEMCIPLIKGGNSNFLLQAWLMGLSPQGITAQQLLAMASRSKYAPNLGPDMGKGSFVAAAYKPWHAAIPQQSSHYRWGPWAAGVDGYGKVEFSIDDSLNPASLGGESQMGNTAMSRIQAVIGQAENRIIETGQISLVGIPAYTFGTQLTYLDDNGDEVKGPYITDLSLSVGSNGLTTNYSFSTQRKFGDLSKIYEDKIRKNQAETTQALSRLEEKMERVRRGIGQYQDKKQ